MSRKVPNQSVLEQAEQGLASSLIKVFLVCYFGKHFMNFNPDTGLRKFRVITMYNVNVILLKFSLKIVKLNIYHKMSINLYLLLSSGIL